MNLRKTFRELKELRTRMVDPTEDQLKRYYEARNYVGAQVLRHEGISNRIADTLRRIVKRKLDIN